VAKAIDYDHTGTANFASSTSEVQVLKDRLAKLEKLLSDSEKHPTKAPPAPGGQPRSFYCYYHGTCTHKGQDCEYMANNPHPKEGEEFTRQRKNLRYGPKEGLKGQLRSAKSA
jgi:hypothetical protein